MKRQERRGADADGDLSDPSWTEEERPESAEQPVAQRQVPRPLASTAQDDQLLLEEEILRDHRSHATGANDFRGHDGQVKQSEHEVPHARDSVGQTSGATQRCLHPGFSRELGFETHRPPAQVERLFYRSARRWTSLTPTGLRHQNRRIGILAPFRATFESGQRLGFAAGRRWRRPRVNT